MKRIPPTQLAILVLLSKRRYVTMEQVIEHLFSHRPECDWPDAPEENVRVYVSYLRRGLREHRITIRMLSAGPGVEGVYSIPPDERKRAKFIADNYWSIMSGDVKLEGLRMPNETDHWKLRAIAATRGNQSQMGAITLAIIGHIPNKRPYFKGLAEIDAQGVIWCLFYARGMHNIIPRMVAIGHVKDYNDELRRLADLVKMDDRERNEFFEEARKWIERDARAKSDLN